MSATSTSSATHAAVAGRAGGPSAGICASAAAGGWLAAGAWALYLPVGAQFATYAGAVLAAAWALSRHGGWPAVWRDTPFRLVLALWSWLLLSAAWTTATPDLIASHLWSYSLMLWFVPLLLSLDPASGHRALRHFVAASCVVSAVIVVHHLLPTAQQVTWMPFVNVLGNQRIAFSLLLALASALALWQALQPGDGRGRWLAALAAALCLAGLALQDRRTGMLTAPLLWLVLGLVRLKSWRPRLLLAGSVGVVAAAAGFGLPTVNERFVEGLHELQAYRTNEELITSWGMRARMLQETLGIVQAQPLRGSGVGSWVSMWRPRVAGNAALAEHTTPHNEYLLLLVQGGAVAGALALVLLACISVRLYRHGHAAVPALLVLVAFLWAALFNVVLRDPKFALPLLMLAAMTGAAARSPAAPLTHEP